MPRLAHEMKGSLVNFPWLLYDNMLRTWVVSWCKLSYDVFKANEHTVQVEHIYWSFS